MTDYTLRTTCRLCDGPIREVLRLPDTALANELATLISTDTDERQDVFEAGGRRFTREEGQQTFPLYLSQCETCGHVQLPVVVDPERLFSNYHYVSSTSPVFREHLSTFARAVRPSSQTDLVVDIGSNDGALLAQYQSLGYRAIGVDPAENLATEANMKCIATVPRFFDEWVAEGIAKHSGRAGLITALNVFAHADDLSAIVRGVARLLTSDGKFVFEVAYLLDTIDGGYFDQIYHEHTSYHHLGPLVPFFERHGLYVNDAERVDVQGGSVRVTVSRIEGRTERLGQMLASEEGLGLGVTSLDVKVVRARRGLLKAAGATICGYGCPAKATTLLAAAWFVVVERLGPLSQLQCIFEDNPLKVGKYSPGTLIPIVSSEELLERNPGALIIFAWNFADDIVRRVREMGYRGKIIVPLPEVRVIE